MNLFKARQASCHFAIQKTVKKRYQNTTTKISKFHYIGIKIPLYGIKIPPIISNYYQIKYQKVMLREFNKTQLRARTCLYARGRAKRCRFAPKNAFIPRTGAEIAHDNVPRTTTKAKKERKARTGIAILFFKKKTRRRRYVKARYFNKKTPRERHIKNAYLYRGKI